ncbi:hypothetical protein BGZ98_006143 [Dissophora globulifera]|nr:hypothetical protein BGZ98_006143 [Dissophora globulifera]
MSSTTLLLGAILALPFIASVIVSRVRVVIIGATSGIGLEVARLYAGRHAHIVVVGRRIGLLKEVARQLEPFASSIHPVAGDVTLPEDVRRITIESLQALKGGIDTLIICAGGISVLPFSELAGTDTARTGAGTAAATTSSLDRSDAIMKLLPGDAQAALDASVRIMNVNYHAPLNLTSHFLPALTQTSLAGNIMVVSSMAGKIGAPTRSIYAASKHAAQGFFESLSMEVERTGVHVGIVSPGTVDTDLRLSAVDLPKSKGDDLKERVASGTKKGAMTAWACAEGIVRGSDLQQREVVMPWFYRVSLVLKLVSPGLVRWLAQKKYGYL